MVRLAARRQQRCHGGRIRVVGDAVQRRRGDAHVGALEVSAVCQEALHLLGRAHCKGTALAVSTWGDGHFRDESQNLLDILEN